MVGVMSFTYSSIGLALGVAKVVGMDVALICLVNMCQEN